MALGLPRGRPRICPTTALGRQCKRGHEDLWVLRRTRRRLKDGAELPVYACVECERISLGSLAQRRAAEDREMRKRLAARADEEHALYDRARAEVLAECAAEGNPYPDAMDLSSGSVAKRITARIEVLRQADIEALI